jgi:uncharacterized protein (TIRG00374 family)
MKRDKALRLSLSLCVATFFTWLFLRQVTLGEIKSVLNKADPAWTSAALGALVAGYACRIERSRMMMAHDNPGSTWRACAGPFLASFAANNVLPLRAGDLLRAFAFNRALGMSSGQVLATMFVERLLDLFTVIAVLVIALTAFGSSKSPAVVGVISLLIAGATLIFLVLLSPSLITPLALAFGTFAARISPHYGGKTLDEIRQSLATLNHLAAGDNLIRLIAWSLIAWIAEGCVFWFSALALPSIARPSASWLAFPVGSLATLMPGSPGEIGTFHYLAARAMAAPGNTAAAATAYALFVHALLWLPITAVGGMCLLFRPIKKTDALRVAQL